MQKMNRHAQLSKKHHNKYEKESQAAQEANRKLMMCERKRAYPTKKAARQKNQDIYRCPYCNLWHRSGKLTTLVNTVRKRGSKKLFKLTLPLDKG